VRVRRVWSTACIDGSQNHEVSRTTGACAFCAARVLTIRGRAMTPEGYRARLHQARTDAGMSQRELAKRIGCSNGTISQVETETP
jgi:ribosome-binding protein aMBF1 (putative translation factor)